MTMRALQDLFQRHRDRATGHWKLSGEGGRTLFLDEGDVVFAASGRSQDRLTSLLVEKGKLTQVQLDYALANLKPGLSVGRNLIDMGYITQRDLLDVARLQVERVVFGALGVADEQPTFDPRELDASVVRLPLDTAQLLLNGLLDLPDREGLLELLGPLNQVVVLEGRRHLALSLPADLTKLLPLFDGTRTLLEIGREVSVEALRLGVFVVFLREMGWARLHELPPLDRGALDLAMTPEPLPMTAPLPEPTDAELPNLFTAIRDAERPTTNLEHLSQSLDTVLETFPVAPVPEAIQAPLEPELFEEETLPEPILEEGRVSMPTPAFELPELPDEALSPEVEPSLALQPDRFPLSEACFESASARLETRPSSGWGMIVAGILAALALLGGGAYLWLGRSTAPGTTAAQDPADAPQATVPPSPENAPQPVPLLAAKPASEAPAPSAPPLVPKTEARPEPVREAPPAVKASASTPPTSKDPRGLNAMRKGALEEALQAGERLAHEARAQWCVRLMLATQVPTVQKAPGLFEDSEPPLFLLPFRFKDGRTAYQVMYGPFGDRAAAEARVRTLPLVFRSKGNRPILFKVAEVPRKQ